MSGKLPVNNETKSPYNKVKHCSLLLHSAPSKQGGLKDKKTRNISDFGTEMLSYQFVIS